MKVSAADIQRIKLQIEEEQKTIVETQQKVTSLLSDLLGKESTVQYLGSSNQMKISLPNKSLISSLFKEDDPNFFFKSERNGRKEQLASERRAEYNAFLEKKERELHSRRKIPKENKSVTPKSILESVDYEKVLARMKEEESRFRNLNHAEPNVEMQVTKSPISTARSSRPTPKSTENPSRVSTPRPLAEPQHIKPPAEPQHIRSPVEPQEISHRDSPKFFRRTGGGGDPVKDSFGNLITVRRFRDVPTGVLGFPSFTQDSSVNKNNYREELKRQIEEKRHLEAVEKQKAQQLEEQIAHRIEQQRIQMQVEYQNELLKNNRRNEQIQQERLLRLETFQKQDAAFRNQRPKDTVLPQSPKELPSSGNKRSTSPPVPAVRSKVILERSMSPVLTTTKALNDVKPENVFSSLAEIRRTIMKEQHNSKKDFKDSYEVTNRRTVPNVLDDYED